MSMLGHSGFYVRAFWYSINMIKLKQLKGVTSIKLTIHYQEEEKRNRYI